MKHVWNRLSEDLLHRNRVFFSGGSFWTGWFSRGSDVSSRTRLGRRQLDGEAPDRVSITDCCCQQQQARRIDMIFCTAVGSESLLALGETIASVYYGYWPTKAYCGILSFSLLRSVFYVKYETWTSIMASRSTAMWGANFSHSLRFLLCCYGFCKELVWLYTIKRKKSSGEIESVKIAYYKHATWICWTALKDWNPSVSGPIVFVMFVPFYMPFIWR